MSFAMMLIGKSYEAMNRSILRCEEDGVQLPPNASASFGIDTLCIRQRASSSRAMNFMRARLRFAPICCCNIWVILLFLSESLIFDFIESKNRQVFLLRY